MTVHECAGSRKRSRLTKQTGIRRKVGLSAGPHDTTLDRALVARLDHPLPQRPSLHERVCTRLQHMHARTLVVHCPSVPRPTHSGPSTHQDTASATRVYLFIRSDDRGMSHSANIGREHAFGTGLSLSTLNTPAAHRFQATAASSVQSSRRSTHVITHARPIRSIGPLQPRLTLMVAHVGIDNRELGALDDRTGSDSSSHVGEPRSVLSGLPAMPRRLAAFSSSRVIS